MSENTLLFTNITNVVLIVLFLLYRYKLKRLETEHLETRALLYEACMKLSNIICICVRLDHKLGTIPKSTAIDIITQQPIADQTKIEHLGYLGVCYDDIKGKANETITRAFQYQMGEKENNKTKNS